MNKILLIGALLSALIVSVIGDQPYNPAQNLAALQDKFNAYRLDLKRLRGAANNIRRTLANNKANETLAVAALQEGMANERDILFNIEGYLTLPFGVSKCDCYEITAVERKRLRHDIKHIKSSLSSLERVVSELTKVDQTQKLQSEIIRQRQYINIVEQSFNSPCCGGYKVNRHIKREAPSGVADLSINVFQTNIKATNWIYGGLTQSQLRLRYFSRSASRNITNCPLETPFFDGKSCINCKDAFPYWDMAKEKCSNCAPDSEYREKERDCVRNKATKVEEEKDVNVTVKPLRQREVSEVVQPIRGPKIINTIRTTRKSGWRSSSRSGSSSVGEVSGGSSDHHENNGARSHQEIDSALERLF